MIHLEIEKKKKKKYKYNKVYDVIERELKKKWNVLIRYLKWKEIHVWLLFLKNGKIKLCMYLESACPKPKLNLTSIKEFSWLNKTLRSDHSLVGDSNIIAEVISAESNLGYSLTHCHSLLN